jgi:hypothetical protein
MARWPHECKAAAQCRFDRGAGGERPGLERRIRPDRVSVEPRSALERADASEMRRGVAEKQLVLGRRAAFAPVREVLEQDDEALLPLGVLTRPVQVRERRMGQDVDRTVSSSSSSDAPPDRASPTR